MNILVINSFLLPDFLDNNNLGGHTIVCEDILKNTSLFKDFDEFLYDRTEEIFKDGKDYDLIVLPYSLNRDNLMEYSGLRLACLIRFTPVFRHQGVPFLFMGPASSEEVYKIDKLGSVLYTSRIFTSNTNDETKFLSLIQDIFSSHFSKDALTEEQYNSLLNRVQIEAPANYGTHHSIANEWAILRWTQMFDWKGNAPSINIDHFKYMLYFKWLMARMGVRDEFKKKELQNPIIPNLPPKSRILYIDDEGDKGWTNLLGAIVHNSGSELIPFTEFKKGLSKEELINNIEKFIEITPAHCYLIDLRLHDDDFTSNTNLSGLKIADDLLKTNRGKQIIILTASNKSWNYETAIKKVGNNKGVLGYVVKESPEYNYSTEETYENFAKLSRLLVEACKNSFIADYVDQLNKFPKFDILENFVDMLCLNKNETIRTNALNLNVFLEDYIIAKNIKNRAANEEPREGSFELEPDTKSRLMRYENKKKVMVAEYDRDKIVFSKDFCSVEFLSTDLIPRNKYTMNDNDPGAPGIFAVVLHYYYHFSNDTCNSVLKLRSIRSKSIAHHYIKFPISLKELRDVFEKVILKMLEKDYGTDKLP